MRKKPTYPVSVLLALAFPAAAFAAVGGDRAQHRTRLAPAKVVDGSPLTRPVTSFHRAIDIGVRRIRAERRAELRLERREAFSMLPAGVSMSTLEAIASCESGGDPTAVSADGSYRGKYQFSFETWASVGGSGDPAEASESEQDYRAALLYASSGSSPWPICG
ncbi:MAG TPA: transglycosylase family protein [Solirubrobacterales bacterium]